jgi:hypothetical protein
MFPKARKARKRREAQRAAEEQLAIAREEERTARDEQRSVHLHELQLSLANLLQSNSELENERNDIDAELQAVRSSMGARLRYLEKKNVELLSTTETQCKEYEQSFAILKEDAKQHQRTHERLNQLTKEQATAIHDYESQLEAAVLVSAEENSAIRILEVEKFKLFETRDALVRKLDQAQTLAKDAKKHASKLMEETARLESIEVRSLRDHEQSEQANSAMRRALSALQVRFNDCNLDRDRLRAALDSVAAPQTPQTPHAVGTTSSLGDQDKVNITCSDSMHQEYAVRLQAMAATVQRQNQEVMVAPMVQSQMNEELDNTTHSTSFSAVNNVRIPPAADKLCTFAIGRTVHVVFEKCERPLGIGFAQMACESQVVIVRSLQLGTAKAPTGVAIHNRKAREQTKGTGREIVVGMCLLGINGVSTASMDYNSAITALKQLPRPVALDFGVLRTVF